MSELRGRADPAFEKTVEWEDYPGRDHLGKCDVFQPDTWDSHTVIVQDPFQWTKVSLAKAEADTQNCAASLGQNKVIETLFFKVSSSTATN